jgi:hypothetical protein
MLTRVQDGGLEPHKDPHVGTKSATNDPMHPDVIMPQLGSLYFLEESTMLAVLYQMGCYETRGKVFRFKKAGWDDLASEFRITSLQLTRCRVGWYAMARYIKIGRTTTTPTQIYADLKKALQAKKNESIPDPVGVHTVVQEARSSNNGKRSEGHSSLWWKCIQR